LTVNKGKMIPGTPCKCCNESGHLTRDCPELYAPLREGFSNKNGTSGVDPDGGEEDELDYIIIKDIDSICTSLIEC
jgi:hypothetical protein